MLRHALAGFVMAIAFVALILLLDLGGLATLVSTSELGVLAVALLTFFTGLTFASLQMGIAVMSMKPQSENDDSAGSAKPVNHWVSQLVPVTVRKRR
ncbi:MAG: hypothetical protein IPK59_07315 [Rhodospirillaceae bacterium]|nr:hypothetical protein [Rhodospirillaceae bacterium]